MHTDPDILALLALGEQAGSPTDHDHVAGCAACQTELAELTRIVEIGQHDDVEIALLVEPPNRVWDKVRSELGFTAEASTIEPRVATVTVLRAPPQRRIAQGILAVAAALVIVLGAGSVIQHRSAPTAVPTIKATMNALPKWPGSSGVAQVVDDASGNRFLVIAMSTPERFTGKQEVWMSDIGAQHMQSMGFLTDGQGRFAIPADLNLSASPVIDISAEPANDTNPKHSGDSIVRCRLPV